MAKKNTITNARNNEMYLKSFQLYGNDKLKDYGVYKYAQFNTRALKDCPFKSKGCTKFCYANKGMHIFANVKEARERSYRDTLRFDFAERMIYTIASECELSRRYGGNNVMLIRLHESGDFYHIDYLRKWLKVWKWINDCMQGKIVICFYTKSFPLFNMLTKAEKNIINDGLKAGTLAISASYDDTYTEAQCKALVEFLKAFPLANMYIASNDEHAKHDDICDCADCAKCGTCINTNGKKVLVKIH